MFFIWNIVTFRKSNWSLNFHWIALEKYIWKTIEFGNYSNLYCSFFNSNFGNRTPIQHVKNYLISNKKKLLKSDNSTRHKCFFHETCFCIKNGPTPTPLRVSETTRPYPLAALFNIITTSVDVLLILIVLTTILKFYDWFYGYFWEITQFSMS